MKSNKSNLAKDAFVIGFALFAMFFGAGNLVFPPYLGWESGTNWFAGFLSFVVADVGLSLLALLVISKIGRGSGGITDKLGKTLSSVLLALNIICIGPLIAIPRTAATTFEVGVQPLFPNANSWVFAILFFLVVIALSIRQSKALDVIGSVLAPLMLVAILVLIVKGIVTPLGVAETQGELRTVIKTGALTGYQTMDVMAAIVFSSTIMLSAVQKGYDTREKQFRVVSVSGIISAVALFLVYGGLAYLGSSVSSVFAGPISQGELLSAITWGLLGRGGSVLLGLIVLLACLTTAIGLVSSSASYFSEASGGRVKYKTLVLVFAVFSCVISNFGISTIISFAAPILDLIYPVLLVLVVLHVFEKWIRNNNIYVFASIGAFVASILMLAEKFAQVNLGMAYMPLADFGFAWLAPAVLMGVVGGFVKPRKRKKNGETTGEAKA